MDLRFTDEERAFRKEVREFIAFKRLQAEARRGRSLHHAFGGLRHAEVAILGVPAQPAVEIRTMGKQKPRNGWMRTVFTAKGGLSIFR